MIRPDLKEWTGPGKRRERMGEEQVVRGLLLTRNAVRPLRRGPAEGSGPGCPATSTAGESCPLPGHRPASALLSLLPLLLLLLLLLR